MMSAPYLVQWFSETPYSDRGLGGPGLNRSVPIGDQAVGAEWSWTGVHDDQRLAGSFNGITASGREVSARGFTLMGVEDELFNGAALRLLGGSLRPARPHTELADADGG
jgi:hypothetical protein